jgi:hypothetical protein
MYRIVPVLFFLDDPVTGSKSGDRKYDNPVGNNAVVGSFLCGLPGDCDFGVVEVPRSGTLMADDGKVQPHAMLREA